MHTHHHGHIAEVEVEVEHQVLHMAAENTNYCTHNSAAAEAAGAGGTNYYSSKYVPVQVSA